MNTELLTYITAVNTSQYFFGVDILWSDWTLQYRLKHTFLFRLL